MTHPSCSLGRVWSACALPRLPGVSRGLCPGKFPLGSSTRHWPHGATGLSGAAGVGEAGGVVLCPMAAEATLPHHPPRKCENHRSEHQGGQSSWPTQWAVLTAQGSVTSPPPTLIFNMLSLHVMCTAQGAGRARVHHARALQGAFFSAQWAVGRRAAER